MRFSIDTKLLMAGLMSVTRAMNAKATQPVLGGIYMQAQGNTLLLRCSDLALQMDCTLPAAVEEEGVTVAPRLFVDYVRKLPEGEVRIVMKDEKKLEIKCGRARSMVQCLKPDNFPEMEFRGESYTIPVNAGKLKDMIRKTVYAASTEESRKIFTGVLVEYIGERLTFVGMDGFRLSLSSENIPGDNLVNRSAVIPARSMNEIARTIDDDTQTIQLTFTSTHVKLDLGHTCIVTRLIDGEYMQYSQILPTTHETRVVFSRVDLLESLERATLLSNEIIGRMVKLVITKTDMHVIANSDMGNIEEELEVTVMGSDITVGFNARYFIDILKCIDDEFLAMNFINNISPCAIEQIHSKDSMFLVLPVRM